MNPYLDPFWLTKLWVKDTAKAKQEETKKKLGSLSDVADTSTNPTKAIAQQKAFPVWLNATEKIQNLANIPKISVSSWPFKFENLLWEQPWWLSSVWINDYGLKPTISESQQDFSKRSEVAKEWVHKEKEQIFNIIKNWWVLTQKDISLASKDMSPEQKQEFISLILETDAKIDGVDFNVPWVDLPKENDFTIWNTWISVNPIKQLWETILDAKQYNKENWSYLTSNPLTQAWMWFAWNAIKWVWNIIEWGAWLLDKGIAWAQSLIQWGDMSQYQTRTTSVWEDLFNVGAGTTQTIGSIYAMPASLLIWTGIEALPEEWQKGISDAMNSLWWVIAKTPGLSQWMESLPPERRDEFKAELAWAAVWLIIWAKNKWNIVKNPKQFIMENLNPTQIAKNFNENVIWLPSKALDTVVDTASKVKMPTVKWDKLNKVSEWLVASTFKQPAMREKYISKVWQTPEKTLLEAGIKWTLEEQTKQVLELSKQSAKKARSEASKIPEKFASPEGSWITDKILEWVDTSIPWIQKKLQPILDMNQRFKDWTATTNDLIDAKTFLSRYEQIYDDFGRVKKTGDTFEKEALADMYSTMKTQVEDLGAKYWVDMEKINYDTMKFEWLRWLMTRALSRESNRDIMWLSDYILWWYWATIDPVSTLVVVWWKKLLQSPNVSSRIANLLYKKKWDNFTSRMEKNDTSVSNASSNNTATKGIQGTVKAPALPERRAVDYIYEWKKKTPADLWSNKDKFGNVIKPYTARDILEEVRAKKAKKNK